MERRTVVTTIGASALASTAGCVEQLDFLSTGPSVEEVKNQSKRIPYNELYRNISEYEGSYVHYPGLYISDVVSGEGTKEYLLMFRGGGFSDERVLYGLWDGDPFKENDNVEIWGVVKGLRTYKSLTGDNTVPEIDIVAMELAN